MANNGTAKGRGGGGNNKPVAAAFKKARGSSAIVNPYLSLSSSSSSGNKGRNSIGSGSISKNGSIPLAAGAASTNGTSSGANGKKQRDVAAMAVATAKKKDPTAAVVGTANKKVVENSSNSNKQKLNALTGAASTSGSRGAGSGTSGGVSGGKSGGGGAAVPVVLSSASASLLVGGKGGIGSGLPSGPAGGNGNKQKSLRAKLKQDIVNLRRAQQMKKLAIEEEKRKRREEKERQKLLQLEQQKKAQQQQQEALAEAAKKEELQQQQQPTPGASSPIDAAGGTNATGKVEAPVVGFVVVDDSPRCSAAATSSSALLGAGGSGSNATTTGGSATRESNSSDSSDSAPPETATTTTTTTTSAVTPTPGRPKGGAMVLASSSSFSAAVVPTGTGTGPSAAPAAPSSNAMLGANTDKAVGGAAAALSEGTPSPSRIAGTVATTWTVETSGGDGGGAGIPSSLPTCAAAADPTPSTTPAATDEPAVMTPAAGTAVQHPTYQQQQQPALEHPYHHQQQLQQTPALIYQQQYASYYNQGYPYHYHQQQQQQYSYYQQQQYYPTTYNSFYPSTGPSWTATQQKQQQQQENPSADAVGSSYWYGGGIPQQQQQQQQLSLYDQRSAYYQYQGGTSAGSCAASTPESVPQLAQVPPYLNQLSSLSTYPPSFNGSAGLGFSSLQKPIPAKRGPRTSAPRISKQVGTSKIAKFEAPNPYFATHALVKTIVLVKPKDGSFGVVLRMDTQSALVQPEWLLEQERQRTKPAPALKQAANAELETKEGGAPSASISQTITGEASAARTAAPHPSNEAGAIAQSLSDKDETEPKTTATESPEAATGAPTPLGQGSGTTEEATPGKVKSEKDVPHQQQQKQRRQRRRRYHFSAVVVQDATIQNDRHAGSNSVDNENLLKPGDVLLQVNGQETTGKTFNETIELIKCCNEASENDSMVRCTVLVARNEVAVAPPVQSKVSVSTSTLGNMAKSGPLSDAEILPLGKCKLISSLDSKCMLGASPGQADDARVQVLLQMEPALSNRSSLVLMKLWTTLCAEIESRAVERALDHWKKEWEKETPEIQELEPMTEALRSHLRYAPRPGKGCRCGSKDHEYLNDPRCPLFSNLRRLAPKDDSVESNPSGTKKMPSKLFRELKVVEKAFKDRILRMKEEQQAEESEARFVRIMEEIQLKVCNRAILAPTSLAAIVLSAVVELQGAFEKEIDRAVETDVPKITGKTGGDNDMGDEEEEDDDEDDDDIPLAALGKRTSKSDMTGPSKKPKRETRVRFKCLALLMKAISEKWGHVYREDSDIDYAWRWEVFHGETGENGSKWEASTTNPRGEGSLSLENIRFVVDDAVISNVEVRNNSSVPAQAAALASLAHVASHDRSGVVHELLALVQTGVLVIDQDGVPTPSSQWWTNVDLLLLEDMRLHWGIKVDPSGRYGIDDRVRKPLAEKWRRNSYGWVLADDPGDIVYDFEEFDVWRECFEEKQQEQTDEAEGIGRFGI